MSTIDNYGKFEVPEEKTQIEIIEDPINCIISSFELFKKMHGEIWKSVFSEPEKVQKIYLSALKIFENKQNLRIGIKDMNELTKIFKSERQSAQNTAGLFLSALQNETAIDTLIITSPLELNLLGYKLKQKKRIILGENITTYNLGSNAKGGIIVNKGNATYLGYLSEGGIQINKEQSTHLGTGGKKSININQGITQYLGNNNCTADGIYINQGMCRVFGVEHGGKGLYINLGEMQSNIIEDIHPYRSKVIRLNHYTCFKKPELKLLKSKLEQKLGELDFLENITDNPSDEELKLLKEFDEIQFEKELANICEEIKEVYYLKNN